MDAILLGRDFTDVGVVEVLTPADDLAIGITRGPHPKRYEYVDPNEDVVAVVREGGVTALVVADGHNGHEGSHALVDGLLDALPDPLPARLDKRPAVIAFHQAHEHMRAVRRQLPGPTRGTRSTMVLAIVARGDDGAAALETAGVGDSAVIVVRDGVATQVTRDRHRFMGDRLSAPEMAGSLDHTVTELVDGDLVVVASDGLTNFTHLDAIGPAVAGLAPKAAVRALVDLAGQGGAGDNIALAVLAHTARGT